MGSSGTTVEKQVIVAGVTMKYFETWGPAGQGSLDGSICPPGEVWKVRGVGISTEDGRQLEYMLQLLIPWPEHTPSPGLRVAIRRETGTAGGTPVLALERELMLLPGETVEARVNGLGSNARMALRWSVFVFPVNELPGLIRSP